MKELIDDCLDDLDGDEKEKTAENENKDIIHRDITENEKETNEYVMKLLIEYLPYDQDDYKKERQQII